MQTDFRVRKRRGFRLAFISLFAAASVAVSGLPAFAEDSEQNVSPSGEPLFDVVTVWDEGEAGVAGHRIPGIVVTNSDVAIATSESRVQIGDADPHSIVVKRSLDGGVTWSPAILVQDHSGGKAWINPTLLYDAVNDRTFLFYGSNGKVYYQTSDNDGLTWSTKVDVSGLFENSPHDWVVNAPGPGHAIQLSTGRLLIPVWHRKVVTAPIAERAYGITALYSDDGGATWERGAPLDVDPKYPINESRVVEREDGSVLVVGRYATGSSNSRVSGVSRDGGETWSLPYLSTGVPAAVAIDSGLARFSGGSDPSRILFSWPAASTRSELTLALSYDEGVTFPRRKLVQSGSSGYSDIAVLSDGTILVLYETVPSIKVARVNLEWLTDGHDSVAEGPASSQLRLEAEALAATASPGVQVAIKPHDALSGREFVEMDGSGPGEYLELDFLVPETGTYDLSYRFAKGDGRAQFQASLDGVNMKGVMNGFATVRSYPVTSLGSVHLTAGVHKLRWTVSGKASGSSGYAVGVDYITLNNFVPDGSSQQITVTVPEATPGEFVWSIDGTNGLVDLGTAVQNGDHFSARGAMNPVRVVDTRSGGAEWSISAQVSDFSGADGVLPGRYLGWSPVIAEAGGGARAGSEVAPGFDNSGEGLSESSTLGFADVGHERGSAVLGAELELKLPLEAPSGTFSTTLTITALS